MKNDELDLTLVAFRTELDTLNADKLNSILKIRFRKKLFILNWLILQNNYKNHTLINSMKKLCEIMAEKYPDEYKESIFAKADYWGKDTVMRVYDFIIKEGLDIGSFFKKYQFLEKSKFAYDFYVKYFTNTDKEGILNNWDAFILAINSYVVTESATIIDTYLKIIAPPEYSPEVTNLIEEKYGTDIMNGEFWELVSKDSKESFRKWLYLKTMESFFGAGNQIIPFFTGYLYDIKKIEYIQDAGVLFVFFENAVLVDVRNDKQIGYLYKNREFDKELERFLSIDDAVMREWNIAYDKILDAKEAIIDEKTSDIYSVSYAFVGRLYLREIIKQEALAKKKKKQ